jgi:hypothetical protein
MPSMPSSGIILAAEIILIGFVIAAIAYEGNFTRYTWWSFSVGNEAIRFVPAAWPCPLFGSDPPPTLISPSIPVIGNYLGICGFSLM